MILTSKNNSLIKETIRLKDKKYRKQLGLFIVEGEKMTKECLNSAFEIERVFVSQNYQGDKGFLASLQDKTVEVTDAVFQGLTDEKSPQGILCRVKIPTLSLKKPEGKCLLLDGVADPGNVGGIIRTANASGYHQVYLTSQCADPYSPKSVRASMSGIFFTQIFIGSREEILALIQDTPLIVADMKGENAFTFIPPKRFVLAIGNEANGISYETQSQADYTVRIPMRQSQESLNACVSAGILMYLLNQDEFVNMK